jgi:hypothetical protein
MYLSAADAVLPALQRTRAFLFRPFRFGTYFKLCLVALLTEGLGGNSHFSSPSGHHQHGDGSGIHSPFHFNPAWIPFIIVAVLAVMALGLVIAYLITRLRFAYFHCLVYNTREIRPGWHIYREPAGRFFLMNIVVGFCFLLALLVIALPFVSGILRIVHQVRAGVHPSFGMIIALLLPMIPLFLLVVLAAFLSDIVLRDFMLPHYALENATVGQAWNAVWERIRAQKGAFFAYALLRFILPIIGVIVLFAILVIPGLIFIAVVALTEVGIHSMLGGAGGPVMILVGLISGLIAVVVGICFGGPLSTAMREYALVFYGGRYQALGEILFPPIAVQGRV